MSGERGSSLTFLDKCWVTAEATMNASCIDREGNSHKLLDTAIENEGITTLAEYMKYGDTRFKNFDPSLKDNEKLMRTYVVPVTLLNGEKINVIVNEKGQDMACIYFDREGNQNQFLVTPRMQKEIMSKGLKNIEGIISTEIVKEGLIPKTLDEFSSEVAKDTLVPKNAKETIDKIKSKAPDADIKAIDEEEEERKESRDDEEAKLPEEAKDVVSKFKSNHRGGKLKQVLVVDDPESITDKLEGPTGITSNGGKVYCLRFSDSGADLGDKVVMIQGEKIVENSKFDDDMTELMNDKTARGVRDLEDHDNKLLFTDETGVTKEIDLIVKPKDLSLKAKELLSVQMIEIEQKLVEKIKQAEELQTQIAEIQEAIEQYGESDNPEIMENVIGPAQDKLTAIQETLGEVYGDIKSLNQSRVELLASKGLDSIVPEIDDTASLAVDDVEAFEVPGKREH